MSITFKISIWLAEKNQVKTRPLFIGQFWLLIQMKKRFAWQRFLLIKAFGITNKINARKSIPVLSSVGMENIKNRIHLFAKQGKLIGIE